MSGYKNAIILKKEEELDVGFVIFAHGSLDLGSLMTDGQKRKPEMPL